MSINKRYSDIVTPLNTKTIFNSDLLPPEIHVKVRSDLTYVVVVFYLIILGCDSIHETTRQAAGRQNSKNKRHPWVSGKVYLE